MSSFLLATRISSFNHRSVGEPEREQAEAKLLNGSPNGRGKHECSHRNTISVIADGSERVICEACGDMIVRYSKTISGDVTRSQFGREDGFLRRLLAADDES